MRGRDQQARNPVGHLRAVALAQQVQAAIDGRYRAGRGDDVVVRDIEHVGAEMDVIGDYLGEASVGASRTRPGRVTAPGRACAIPAR